MTQFNPQNSDLKLLEHHTKRLIDSVRTANNLKALYNDSILYLASSWHANYMSKKKLLTHDEVGNKDYVNPQKRALTFGAPSSYLVGENVAMTPYNSNVKVKSKIFVTNNELEIARCFVLSWCNSKGHFKNIIDSSYQITGLSISCDIKNQVIYACQKFAHVLYKYEFQENTNFFPYSTSNYPETQEKVIEQKLEYPFKLKIDTNKCITCKDEWEKFEGLSVYISKGNFILRVDNAEWVKSLLKEKNDGFAIEIVQFNDYACGNPNYEKRNSRRNNKSRLNGIILEPVYRKDLIKGFKKRKRNNDVSYTNFILKADSIAFFKRFGAYTLAKFNAEYFEIKLGKVAKNINGWWNHNLVYIHDKQLCHFSFLTNYPGEISGEVLEVAYHPPIPIDNYEIELERYADTLEVFFKSGETVCSDKALKSLITKFNEKNLHIDKISVNGFSSVDGIEVENEKLHEARTANIRKQLEEFCSQETVFSEKSEIAWEHFYKTVNENPKWRSLVKLSKEEIRTYLLNPKNESLESVLKEERKAIIQVQATRLLTKNNAMYYLKKAINNNIVKDAKGKFHSKDIDQLQRIYQKAYYFASIDTISVAEFMSIQIPENLVNSSHSFMHDKAFYEYHLLKDNANAFQKAGLEMAIENTFQECQMAEHLSPEFHYLSALLMVEKIQAKNSKVTVNDPLIEKVFNRLNSLLAQHKVDSVFYIDVARANLNLIYSVVQSIGKEKIYDYRDVINNSLIQIIQYYENTKQLNKEKAYELSKMLCYFDQISLAVYLLEPHISDDKCLKLYLPLAFIHTSYLSTDEEFEFEEKFHELLMEAKQRLSSDEWCKLFYGEYGIPFQIMDKYQLHHEFCETCPKRVEEVFKEFNDY